MMKKTLLIATSLICILPGLTAQSDDPIQLPDVVASANVKSRAIKVQADSPVLQRRAESLFSLHGGYRLVDEERPDFTFAFTEAGNNQVSLTISSGGKPLFSEAYRAASQSEALALAADAAVRKTLGIPGFFAGTIAFISDRNGHAEVYLSDLQFQNIRQLTKDRSEALLPELSPDGGTLLYTSYHGSGFPDIYRIDLASGRRSPFAAFKGTNTGATYSPDGKTIAMILSGSGNSEVYLSDPDGGNLRRLTRTKSLEADPTWAPDGRRLALTSDQMGKPQIYTIQANGQNFQRVRTDISRNCSEPVWNPKKADLLAFTAAIGGDFEIAIYDFQKGKSTIVSKGSGDAVHPIWLNDGRHLIYTQRTTQFKRLMILDTETGNRSRLSPSELNDASMGTFIYNP